MPISFSDAVARFKEFLRSQGRPDKIRWVFPEDVVFMCQKLYLRPQPDQKAVTIVSSWYEEARDRDIVIEIAVLEYDEQATYCFLSMISGNEEAKGRSQDDEVKFSIVNTPPPLRLIHNKTLWKLLGYFKGAGAEYVEFLFHRHVGLVVKQGP